MDRRDRDLGPDHPDTQASAKTLARYLDANEGIPAVMRLFRGTLERNQQKYIYRRAPADADQCA